MEHLESRKMVVDIIKDISSEFNENSGQKEISVKITIDSLYQKLAQALVDVISKAEDGETLNQPYEHLYGQIYNANLCLLSTFGSEAFEGFDHMIPSLDRLLQQENTTGVLVGLKMYADFIKKSSTIKDASENCYSYKYKDNILSVVKNCLDDKRPEVSTAACKIVIYLASYEGANFKKQLSVILPKLLNILHKFNNFKLHTNEYQSSSTTENDWPRSAKVLANVASSSVKSIFKIQEVNLSTPRAVELIISKILLSEEGTKWKEFFTSNIDIFKRAGDEKPKIVIMWEVVYAYLRDQIMKNMSNGSSSIIMVCSHILRKMSSMINCSQDMSPAYQEQTIVQFYEILRSIITTFKSGLSEENIDDENGIFQIVLTNLYAIVKDTYTNKREIISSHHLQKIVLPICDFMLDADRGCHELKFVMSIHADIIQHSSPSDKALMLKYKKRLMPSIMTVLEHKHCKKTLTALNILGKVAEHGGVNYLPECKSGLKRIQNILEELDTSSLEGEPEANPAIKDAATAAMTGIINMTNSNKQNVDRSLPISQLMDCFSEVSKHIDRKTENNHVAESVCERGSKNGRSGKWGVAFKALSQTMNEMNVKENSHLLENLGKSASTSATSRGSKTQVENFMSMSRNQEIPKGIGKLFKSTFMKKLK